jgi:glycosyltransferase involved in cell wall biosynthesis
MKKPLLSIGLPVYNGERYLSKALDSLLQQDFRDFELIISDNGSTDRTETICGEVAARDSRIRYVRNDRNRGATWNFRNVIELAEGEFFKFAAYDDECYPTMLSRCMEVMLEGDASVALVYTRSEVIDENSNVVACDGSPKWDAVATSAANAPARFRHVLWRALHGQAFYGVMRSSFLRQLRPYGSVAADWVILAQLSMLGKIMEVPEILFRLRRHPTNSWNGQSTSQQVLAWHNPNSKKLEKALPFRVAIVLEHLKSVCHLPLSPWDKIICLPLALLVPPTRSIWIWLLRKTGPVRWHLRTVTGWRALHPSSGS